MMGGGNVVEGSNNNRAQRAATAKETLLISQKGSYKTRNGERINIKDAIKKSIEGTILYIPEGLKEVEQYANNQINKISKGDINPKQGAIEVTNEPTLRASRRLYEQNYNVVCLNFASAKNPGGGFLKGSAAQEESLARASALYSCLMSKQEMYHINKNYPSALYTNHMIYSPKVPVFRDDNDEILDEPFYTDIITAPAVNAGVVRAKEPENMPLIEKTMKERIKYILSLAVYHGCDGVVLGAFGCGVFKNDPEQVANSFAELIIDHEGNPHKFGKLFENITFAVLNRSKEKSVFNSFKKIIHPT